MHSKIPKIWWFSEPGQKNSTHCTLESTEIENNLDYLEEVAFGSDMLAQQSLMENSMDFSNLYDSFGSYADFKLESKKKDEDRK